jgi:hypothetical protein
MAARSIRMWPLVTRVLFLLAPVVFAEVVIDWATVGDLGNVCHRQLHGCFNAAAVLVSGRESNKTEP